MQTTDEAARSRRRLLAQFLLREGEQRAVSQPAAITLPSLSRRDDVLGENFPSGQSVILGGEWCLAGLNKSPRRLEVENLFLRHQLSIALRRAPCTAQQ
jgi:hypothetical protein